MSQMLQPIKVDLGEIGLEAMQDVGPGGHFFGCDHTMARYENAFYQPFLSDWQNHENWVAAGSKTTTERATETWQRVLNEFEAPPMDPAIREQLIEYCRKRKESLGSNEPELEPIMP